jgi:Ca2+-binding EF-hand superfamily protein
MGELLSSEEIALLLEEIDEDGDGYINFQEFLKLMYKEEEQI